MLTFPRSTIPTLPLLGLSEDEQRLIQTLQSRGIADRAEMAITEAYYLGLQIIANLQIAVPPELEFLRTLVGWPAMAVDPYVERLQADCFRLTRATDGDQTLMDIMDANGFASEQSLAYTDALAMRRAYWMLGSPTESGAAPVITVESPLNMSVLWDMQGREPRAAMQEYFAEDGTRRGAVLVPGKTIQLGTDDNGQWVVADRDEHDFDFVPVVQMANRARSNNRGGRSEISNALMSIVDSACRTLLGLEVAREIYSTPQKAILGATEDAFVKSDGSTASVMETYVTKVLGLERDENGDLPELFQWQAYDPAVFTKLIEMYAAQASGIVAATPQDLGLYTDGNPASADQVVAMESRRDRRAIRMQNEFGTPLVRVGQMAMRFENNGRLPTEYERLAVDWNPVTMDTQVATSDAVTKEISAGSVPPTSDVVLKRLGYSAVERARLEQDRKREDGRQAARAIAESLIPPTAPPAPEVDGGSAPGL